MLLWLALSACSPAIPGAPDDSDGGTGGPGVLAADTATEHLEGVPSGEEDEHGCADIYDQELVPTYELVMGDEEWDALERDFQAGRKEYRRATFRYGPEEREVQVRLKGNPSFSWFGEKMQFVISFNEDDPGARWHGLRKLALDASWYEPTLLRDRLSWWIMRPVEDLPAACANNALLVVNGEPYGAYTSIEYFDHEYLERVFGDEGATGTLWKYGQEPKANEEAADWGALSAFWGASGSVAAMQAAGDTDQWTRMWAAEAVLGDDDGFVCCEHNFYVYDHPERGMLLLPWDFDDVMDVAPHTSDPIEGYPQDAYRLFEQDHFVRAMADPAWRAAYVDEVAALNERLDPDVVLPQLDAWDAQIADIVAADTVHTWGLEERAQTMDRLRAWITARHAFLEAWVACERGAPVDTDGDGLDSCSDLDDSVPVAAETCNGRDDDNDGLIDNDPACEDCARRDLDARHFLYCRSPRTAAEAQAHCAEEGGTLATLADTPAYTMTFFYAWPVTEPWWLAGERSGECLSWDEGAFNFSYEDCGEAHPSICQLP